jgi:uncharacterized metal-binding protein YceD (DUF177 family)
LPSFSKSRAVKGLQDYIVSYVGLKEGKHRLDFELDPTFFTYFEYSEVEECHVKIEAAFEKGSSMMVFDFQLKGEATVPCDRCQENVTLPVDHSERLIIRFGDHTESESDDIIIHGPNEHQIDLSHFFYEYIHLALPAKRVHESLAECNKDVIKILEKMLVESKDEIDPRWDSLRNIVDK